MGKQSLENTQPVFCLLSSDCLNNTVFISESQVFPHQCSQLEYEYWDLLESTREYNISPQLRQSNGPASVMEVGRKW